MFKNGLKLLDRPLLTGALAIKTLPVHENAAVTTVAATAGLQCIKGLLEHFFEVGAALLHQLAQIPRAARH